MVAFRSPSKSKQIESISSVLYQQLEIYQYILEARKPTLAELCAQLPQSQPPKSRRRRKRRTLDDSQRKYPKNWKIIARQIKEERNYVCQVCGLQCLRPEDDKSYLTLSEIGQLTANCHHIDGNGFNNCPENLLVVCSTHHLFIHRGRRRNPPRGQGSLFDCLNNPIDLSK